MILTKDQLEIIMELLPSDNRCTPEAIEIKSRIRHELDTINKMEEKGVDKFIQFMSRVGSYETSNYIYNFVGRTNSIVISRKSNGVMLAVYRNNDMFVLTQPNNRKYVPKFNVCKHCGAPVQEDTICGFCYEGGKN